MQIVDPHVDVADMYKYFNHELEAFFNPRSEAPVTLKKIREAEVDLIGLTLYFDESFVETSFYDGVNEFYTFNERLVSHKKGVFHRIETADDVGSKPDDAIGYFYSIEGLECLRTPQDFEAFFNKGVRVFGLTWSFENAYAHGRHSKQDDGITESGFHVLEQMNQKKLIVDIAHLSEQSVKNLEANFDGMIVSTHGNLRAVHETIHNLKDEEVE